MLSGNATSIFRSAITDTLHDAMAAGRGMSMEIHALTPGVYTDPVQAGDRPALGACGRARAARCSSTAGNSPAHVAPLLAFARGAGCHCRRCA